MDRTKASPKTIYLKDYKASDYLIDSVALRFELEDGCTRVFSKLEIYRNSASVTPLMLDGEALKLISVSLDGNALAEDQYSVDDRSLTIHEVPGRFVVEIETEINPAANTSLEGLYLSSGNYCTQCEAEGFRKITYYLDRPDVMTEFTTVIEADKKKFPVLLSNGNLVERSDLDDGRHTVRWHDPFKKPSYLFALVAGDLALTTDSYTTKSGRKVALEIYTEHHNADKTAHAMASLKRAMQWDEGTFGLEYDLDIYMIVAVDDFNMGAMENKGLNIFNSKYVLASPETATDSDYINIEAVIAHEYFHNWTGNRVTCRDWFQLSLKEGLTVFRDQSFTADLHSAAVKRIEDVRLLRGYQFTEDASPMAHPVRPQSYMEINNFYTSTVYNKGAEVVRMYQTLLAKEGFRKGMDLYFQRHDGQAVTTDDFRNAMADANTADLEQFQNWYDQAGTPELFVTDQWDESAGEYLLRFRQKCPPTPQQEEKQPFVIPVRSSLLSSRGETLLPETVINITEENQSFQFSGLSERPVPSLLRGFSAPVKLRFDYSSEQLAFMMANETDEFNRWEASQKLAMRVLLKLVRSIQSDQSLSVDPAFIKAFKKTLNSNTDPALIAEALTLPIENNIAEEMKVIDPEAIYKARKFLQKTLAENLKDDWFRVYKSNHTEGAYSNDSIASAKRRLKNCALTYLQRLETEEVRKLAMDQFQRSKNMTDSLSALRALSIQDSKENKEAMTKFYDRWKDDNLVINNWLGIQASMPLSKTLKTVKNLFDNPVFSIKNPNKVRALIGTFAQGNQRRFHWQDGSGYRFVADQVLTLDPINPQVAASLVRVFTRWRRFDQDRQVLMKTELERIKSQAGLSKDVFEIVGKSLQG